VRAPPSCQDSRPVAAVGTACVWRLVPTPATAARAGSGGCAEAQCAHRDGRSRAAFVVQAFVEAIAPAQLETLDEVLAQRQQER
jgi:hypothetical protein